MIVDTTRACLMSVLLVPPFASRSVPARFETYLLGDRGSGADVGGPPADSSWISDAQCDRRSQRHDVVDTALPRLDGYLALTAMQPWRVFPVGAASRLIYGDGAVDPARSTGQHAADVFGTAAPSSERRGWR
jgi:hypothetical protein